MDGFEVKAIKDLVDILKTLHQMEEENAKNDILANMNASERLFAIKEIFYKLLASTPPEQKDLLFDKLQDLIDDNRH